MNIVDELRGPMPMYHSEERAIRTKAAAEIERLRAIARDARDHVPADVLARIDAALGTSRVEQTGDSNG